MTPALPAHPVPSVSRHPAATDGFVVTREHVAWLGELVWGGDDESAWLPWLAPDFEARLPGRPLLKGDRAFADLVTHVRASQPDLVVMVTAVIVDRDVAALRATFRGRHLGPLLGIPPTGRSLVLHEHIVERFDGRGRIIELHQEADYQGMLTQLGILPPPGTGPLGQVLHTVATAVRMNRLERRHRHGRSPR